MKFSRLATPLLGMSLLSFAQDPRGAIGGQITDPSNAPVPGVTVRFTHADTNVSTSATSNAQGNYDMPYLPIGEYKIATELTGFKSWNRSGVRVRIGDRLRLDIQLEVGNVTETIDVTAQAPVLESTTGSIGQVIDSKQFSEMPLRSGSISWLYGMAPATVLTSLPYDGPWNIAQSSGLSIAGARAGGIDFNVDGVSNNSYDGQTAFVPPPDMVEEVRISTTSYDAAVGHTSGASIDVSLKSGGNALHGTLGASVSSGPMMTRNFFTNGFIFNPATGPITPEKIKANTPSTRWLRYSAGVGGPVYIPKLYDGRNKTFWMFGYQSHERRRPVATVHSVATEAQRGGNFSELLRLGNNYQIYDPFSTRAAGARFQRDPLPNNLVPANRIDPTARAILKYFPLPNTAGTADGSNNYARTRVDTQDLYQPVVRLDHNFSEKHKMFARYSQSDFYGHFDELISGSNVRGRRRMRPHRGFALDNVGVLGPSMVLDVRYGFTWFREYESFDNIGFDLSEFGFPQSLTSQLDPNGISFPAITVTNYLPLGNNGGFSRINHAHTLLSVLNWNKGNHSIKFGFDGRLLFETNYTYGNVSPALTFDSVYTRGPLDNSPASPNSQGQAFASYLYGIPGGGIDLNDSRAEHSRFYSLFIQDDWRLTRKLTLNLGLRWEYESPMTERFNRATRDFDFSVANPIQARAQAAYAAAPISEVPAAQFRTTGGVTFLGVGGNPRGIRDPFYKAYMPRVGFAYQLTPLIVLRGGYGIFFGLIGAEFSDVSQPGFNQRTSIVPTLNNGITYVASISNPLPSGLEKPLGAAGGLGTFLGRAPAFFAADGRRPYTQRWSYSIQFQPFSRAVLELGYIGSRSTRLRATREFDPTPRQYLSTSPTRDNAAINFLSATVPNPFRGLPGFEGTAFAAGANTTRAQVLKPYPHFNSLVTGLPAGSAWYNAFTLRFERRFQAGFLFQANYTWSKTMEAVAYRNDTDDIPEHLAPDIDRPHRITFATMYELPFGRGKRFGSGVNRVVNHVIGGWQVQAIYQGQSGPPLTFGNVIYTGTYQDLRLSGSEQSIQQWFNTNGFERNSNAQLANNIRTFPNRVTAARADGINAWDLSAHKNFKVHEKLTVQMRGEAEGAMNTPNFSPPNTVPANTLFGQVTTTQTGQEERRIFVTLKLLF